MNIEKERRFRRLQDLKKAGDIVVIKLDTYRAAKHIPLLDWKTAIFVSSEPKMCTMAQTCKNTIKRDLPINCPNRGHLGCGINAN